MADSDPPERPELPELPGALPRSIDGSAPRLRLVDAHSSSSGDLPPIPATESQSRPLFFGDVGGLDEIKETIRRRMLQPLREPALHAAYGRRAGGRLLFYGPPGCGKTHLCNATAGEAGLPFIRVTVEDVLDMWLGQSEKRLHAVFDEALARAPSVLFFDEVDALSGRRSALRHESYRTLVTQFLTEMDRAFSSPGPVLILGTTNTPWDIDPAFRRPGRFTDVLFVPPPDLASRAAILRLQLKDKPQDPQDPVDFAELARRTELYSGADLYALVEAATDATLSHARHSNELLPITTKTLLQSLVNRGATTREWLTTAKAFVTHGNAAGQYDDLARFLSQNRSI